jgi:hypothetical protein
LALLVKLNELLQRAVGDHAQTCDDLLGGQGEGGVEFGLGDRLQLGAPTTFGYAARL